MRRTGHVCRAAAAWVMALLLIHAGRAAAALVAWDEFESYSAGADLNGTAGGEGWSGAWSAAPGQVSVAGGVMTGLGQSLAIATSGTNDNLLERAFPAQTGTLYVGLHLRTTGWGATNFLQVCLNDEAGATFNTSMSGGVRNVAGNPYFARVGASSYSTNSTTAFHQDGAIETMVLRLSKSVPGAGSPYDRTDVFVNRATEAIADATYTGNTFGGAVLSRLHLRTYTIDAGDRIYIDVLHIATDYAAALAPVPEPGCGGLIAGALAALVRRRSRPGRR